MLLLVLLHLPVLLVVPVLLTEQILLLQQRLRLLLALLQKQQTAADTAAARANAYCCQDVLLMNMLPMRRLRHATGPPKMQPHDAHSLGQSTRQQTNVKTGCTCSARLPTPSGVNPDEHRM